jgi:hypothetical protein
MRAVGRPVFRFIPRTSLGRLTLVFVVVQVLSCLVTAGVVVDVPGVKLNYAAVAIAWGHAEIQLADFHGPSTRTHAWLQPMLMLPPWVIPRAYGASGISYSLILPVWTWFIPWMAALAVRDRSWIIRRGRRRARARCTECGYDLAGSAGGVCPECGASTAKQPGGQSSAEAPEPPKAP